MDGDDSVQDLQFNSGTNVKLRSRKSASQSLLKHRVKKMDGEEKKSESKKRSKPVEIGFDSDDDEPIGSLFKLKKQRNPKKAKGQTTEAREDKVTVEDDDLVGGMDDTLASFRKKLKGPKKDAGSGVLNGRGSALNGSLDDDWVLDVKLAPKHDEKVGVTCEDGSGVALDNGVETKCKERVKRPKIDSKMTIIRNHVCDDDSKCLCCRDDSLEDLKEEELSTFFQRTFFQRIQSGFLRKTRTNSGLKQDIKDWSLGDGSVPSSEGDSKSIRRSQSVSSSKLPRKNPKSDNSSNTVSDLRTLELDSDQCKTVGPTLETYHSNVQGELTTDPCSSNKVCDSDGKAHTCFPVGHTSAPGQKARSDTQTLDELKLSSKEKASTFLLDVVEAPDPASSSKAMEEFHEFEGESDRGFTDALDLQSNSISAMNVSSSEPEISSSSTGKEVSLPCAEDVLASKSCKTRSKQIHVSASEKNLQPTSKLLTQKSLGAEKSESWFHFDQCPTGSQQIPLPLTNPSSNFLEMAKTLRDDPITYTGEPCCAADSSNKENAVLSDGRFSATTKLSPELQESGLNFQKCSSVFNKNQPSDASKETCVPGHGAFSTDEDANGGSPSSVAPDENGSFTEDTLSMPDSENRDTKLSAVQRAVRNAKKRRLGDMAYEGDADWEILINEQRFLENHQVVDYERALRTRDKFDSSSTTLAEAENVGAAAIAVGLKARAAGPIERIKFKEILKRRGGLQEYLECRNQILSLWSGDVGRILPLTECGVSDTPLGDEPSRASLIREIYKFLDQSGYINVGIASMKEKADHNAKHSYKLLKEERLEKSSGASIADSEDGVAFILGQVKNSETTTEAKDGVECNDGSQKIGIKTGGPMIPELPNEKRQKVSVVDDCQQRVDSDPKASNRLVSVDVSCDDPSCRMADGGTVPLTIEERNESQRVQSASYDDAGENRHLHSDIDVKKRIIVIGAGPAGLTAARHLKRQGFSVTVLEARNRIGGRVYTDRTSLSVPVDLGASIITGVEADVATERRADPSSLVCAQLGLELTVLNSDCPLYDIVSGQKVPADMDEALEAEFNSLLDDMVLLVAQKGEHAMKMSLEDGLEYALKRRRMARLGRGFEALQLHNSMDVYSKTSSVDSRVPDKDCSREEILSPVERRVMDWHFANLEYGCAALLKEVSLPFWNQDDVYGGFGGAHCMIKGGYSTVVEALGKELLVHYNHVVTDISYGFKDSDLSDGHPRVKVSTSNGSEFSGDAVLITVPLGCLKAESIKFSPPLPQWKYSAIQRLGFGVLNKVVLEFPEVFWDDTVDYFGATAKETDLRGQCFMFWNVKKTVGAPVLIALVVGKAAIDGQNVSSSDHVNHAVMVLRQIFGVASVPDPVASVVTDWGRDPFSYGAYSYVATGASGEDYDILGRPVENCLFFAGEATCKEHPDTVGGAMLSGLRQAVRIIDILTTGNDFTAEVESMEAAQMQSESEGDEVRDITRRLEAVELSNVLYKNSLDRALILTRESLLQDMFFNAKTTAGRLHLAKELLNLPAATLKSFAGTKEGLTTLNSWILDSMGKDGTQLLRHCVRLLVRVSTDLLAVRVSGIGKTVREKVCVHTSRDIRAIASQLVSVWLEVFRKEKASSRLKVLRQSTAVDSIKRKSLKDPYSGKPPLHSHHGGLESKVSPGSHLTSNANNKKEHGKTMKLGSELEDKCFTMSEEEQAAFAAAEAARAAAEAAALAAAEANAKAYATSGPQLPKILSFNKFAKLGQYGQMDDYDLRRKWSGGVLGRQDCISEIDSRNCRVRDWSVDFSAACVNLESSRMSADNLSQRSYSNEIACHLNFTERSGESAAVDSSILTKAWVDTAGSEGIKDYHAIERWQSQAAAADPDFYRPAMRIKDEEDSNTSSMPHTRKHDRQANKSSVSQVTVNKESLKNHTRGADRIKRAVVKYVETLLMPLYKAKKIDKDGYKSIMKKSATKVMEQATDAEKAMAVPVFLDFKRRNKIRSFVDKLIERHMAMKPTVKS